MLSETFKNEIQEQLERLGTDQQLQVLDFAKALASKDLDLNEPQKLNITRFAGRISLADLEIMSKEIEEGCERINPDEW